MPNKLLIVFYSGIALGGTQLLAQTNSSYVFRHLDQSDGLLHTDVGDITQDKKGYIWILTENGLQRYDGSRFVNYSYDLNNPRGIIDPRLAGLYTDKENDCIWVISEDIQKLDLRKDKFTRYETEKVIPDIHFKFEDYTDSSGVRWVLGDVGAFHYDDHSKKMIPHGLAIPALSPGKSNFFFTDRHNGETWIVSWWHGLSLFQKKTKKIYSHDFNPLGNPLLLQMDKKTLTCILKDSENNIWIGTGNRSFFRYNIVTKKLVTYSLADIKKTTATNLNQDGVLSVRCFFEDNRHTLWVATGSAGLLRYDRDKDSFASIVSDEQNKQGLHYNYDISCIFQDAEENIWLGTDKGINIFNPYHQYFRSIHHLENDSLSLTKNEIQDFIQTANGDILAGTYGGGITLYDANWNFKKNIYFAIPYEYNMVWSFVQNDDGTIWAGCQHGFIHIYNPETKSIRTIHPAEMSGYTIRCMVKDQKGNIWMGLHNGKIAEWDKRQNRFYAYNDSVKGIATTYSPVLNIFLDSKHRCWVSTSTDLRQFDTDKRIYSAVYTHDKNNSQSISASMIGGVEEYNDSVIVIGTMYGGMNFFNMNKKTFSSLTINDGFPSNTIYAVKKDASGYLWFTTDYNLYKFKPGEKKFTHYTIETGIINSAFKSTSFRTFSDGRWITSTGTEIICFVPDPAELQNARTPKVEVTGFRVYDHPLFIDSLLSVNRPVQLTYRQNFLTIEFSLLDFSNPRQATYYYKLSGINSDWINADTKQFASYTNLEPGEYTFSVKADSGNNTTGITSFKITIAPPFWKTWWFKLLILLLVTALVYALIKRRIKVIEHEAKMKQKIAETEMLALRAQMNPHFIFNCLNSIDNLIQNNEKERATAYLSKFAKLIRSILETTKNNAVPCWKDTETLKVYLELEELRWDKKLCFKINIADEIVHGDYKVPPLIIQPFVENAIHHGLLNKIESDRKLKIDICVRDNRIHYVIEDNGVGRAKAGSYRQLNKPGHESMGMQITTDRIKLFNQYNNDAVKVTDLYDPLGQPTGTRVEVMLVNQP